MNRIALRVVAFVAGSAIMSAVFAAQSAAERAHPAAPAAAGTSSQRI